MLRQNDIWLNAPDSGAIYFETPSVLLPVGFDLEADRVHPLNNAVM